LPGLSLQPIELAQETSKFDLSLIATESGGGIDCTFELNTDLFERSTLARWAGHLELMLAAAAERPELPIDVLPLLADSERRQLATRCNDTARAYPRESTVAALFEEQARLNPGAPAVLFEDRALTYSELNARANQLARKLGSLGIG